MVKFYNHHYCMQNFKRLPDLHASCTRFIRVHWMNAFITHTRIWKQCLCSFLLTIQAKFNEMAHLSKRRSSFQKGTCSPRIALLLCVIFMTTNQSKFKFFWRNFELPWNYSKNVNCNFIDNGSLLVYTKKNSHLVSIEFRNQALHSKNKCIAHKFKWRI